MFKILHFSLAIAVALISLTVYAQEEISDPKHKLYGGNNAGSLLGKSLVVTNQLDWINAWSKELGGKPPEDLPRGFIGVLAFASYPGHLISLQPQDDGASMKINCRQVPLPDNRSYIAPAAWAAGMFRADSVTLEGCP